MKEILQNKLLIVFLIVFTLIGTICSSVYAVDFVYDDVIYTVPPYHDLLFSSYHCIFLGTYDNYFLCVTGNSDGIRYYSDNGGSVCAKNCKVYKLDKTSNSWVIYGDEIGGAFNHFASVKKMLYTSVDIYDFHIMDSSPTGNLVFQGAPQEVELVQAMKVEEIPQKITQIVAIILPIFLLIFGTLLLIYLIRSKNLFQI